MLNRRSLIKKLNWFYSLELTQVDLYTAQSKSVTDFYLKKTLTRVAVIEQQHVDNISATIRELGATPTRTGDLIAPRAGKLAGKIIANFGVIKLLKINIALEKKAMHDYKNFILRSGKRGKLFELLWSNLIDEDLHTAWFAGKINQLIKK